MNEKKYKPDKWIVALGIYNAAGTLLSFWQGGVIPSFICLIFSLFFILVLQSRTNEEISLKARNFWDAHKQWILIIAISVPTFIFIKPVYPLDARMNTLRLLSQSIAQNVIF